VLQGLWAVPAHTLHRLPQSLSLEQGALIEPIMVACHDVPLGDVQAGEYVVVQGGGPIGLLIPLVARSRGAHVAISEVNPFRLELARQFGFEAVNPLEIDLVQRIMDETQTAGVDVVLEVSGSAACAEMMSRLPRTRGRLWSSPFFHSRLMPWGGGLPVMPATSRTVPLFTPLYGGYAWTFLPLTS
jgi:threonine dehydrogenase-like Zn-dependent dehydrogenase